ncbi:MAG TPA: phosphatase PAP2 family protein [Thermoanaerobaculia bacterium]|nr:phosphatase PAP2 family protein [Thermoanaerobaculia bacterium]
MRRPYFFEIFALVNLAAIALFAWASLPIVGSPIAHLIAFAVAFGTQALVGVIVRVIIALVRRDRSYLIAIRSVGWLVDTLRLLVGSAAVIVAYGWIKLVVPIYHPRLFDAELWDLDRILFLGIAPTTFFLDLFGAPWFLRVIDWTYANIFFVSGSIAYAWLFSHPERRIRIAFANGNAALWISGAWLYLLLPSLGPALRFPEVWFAHSEGLRVTQGLQAILMRNYQNVIRAWNGEAITEPIRIVFGIGAFPSMHVAFQMFVFLWTRRLWRAGQVLFGIFVFVIFLGSMITGWHYLIDSIAGLVMAYLSYRACFPKHADDAGNDAGRSAGGADRAGSAGVSGSAAE